MNFQQFYYYIINIFFLHTSIPFGFITKNYILTRTFVQVESTFVLYLKIVFLTGIFRHIFYSCSKCV
nr:MAG TPA: hypothetical protein [Caudoviricetes sp.]